MPPFILQAPAWLPDWLEQFAGARIEQGARFTRLRASTGPILPDGIDPALQAWLLPE